MKSVVYCAGYARRSHRQNAAEQCQSVAEQVALFRRFCAEMTKTTGRRWVLLEEHLYIDNEVSGGELRRRRSHRRLIEVIFSGRAPFSVLLIRDKSRLSRRDGEESFGELKRIARAGVEIWQCLKREKFSYGTFGENVVGMVEGEMNAEYRRMISALIRPAMRAKAEAGHVTGRIPYGYAGVPHYLSTGERSHVTMTIHVEHAKIVERIFRRALAGAGVQRIASELNAEKVAPITTKARYGWSSTAVRHVLMNPIYRGLVRYGVRDFRESDGERRTVAVLREKSAVFERVDESLRIVSDRDWQAVQDRLASVTADLVARDGKNRGGKQRDGASKYLLSGFARCAECRGPMCVISRAGVGGGPRRYLYNCLNYHRRGSRYCSAATTLAIETVDAGVLEEVERLLLPTVSIGEIVDALFVEVGARKVSKAVDGWRTDLAKLEDERDNLVAVVKAGGAKTAAILAASIEETAAAIADLEEKIASASDAGRGPMVSRAEVTRRIKGKLDVWRSVLRRGSIADRREMLREILDGPVWMTGTKKPGETRKDAHAFTVEGAILEGVLFTATLPTTERSLMVPFRGWKTKFLKKIAAPAAA